MFIADHPEIAAGIFAYDPAVPDEEQAPSYIADTPRDALEYAQSIAMEYAHHETARLLADLTASSSTALGLIATLHDRATSLVCDELQSDLLYLTDWWQPGWEATFTAEAVQSAAHAGLIAAHQLPLCQTWVTALEQDGVAIFAGAHNPLLDRPALEDARVLLALTVMALRAMGDHAGEAFGGLQEISAGNIEMTERLLPMYPLPGLPRLPFRDEEAARYAGRFIGR